MAESGAPARADFDESADMRLLELQRAALGVAPPKRTSWESRFEDDGVVVEAEPAQELSSAVLAVEMTATPGADVIPGAIVTLALSIANEGSATARDISAAVPLPGGATFRNGSFVRDGRPMLDDEAERFFSTGLAIASMAPKTRATFLWKIGVRIGNNPIVLSPSVVAGQGAIVGAKPVSVSRKPGAQNAFAAEVARAVPPPVPVVEPETAEELPIYELDEEEVLVHEAADAALSAPAVEAEYRPAVPPVEPVPEQPPAPDEPLPEPAEPEPPDQPPDFEPAAREGVVLLGELDRPSLAYFERLFNAQKAPTLLNHFMLGSALACTRAPSGDDAAGLKAHMDAQGQILQRVVLHEKLGKKEPILEYAGRLLARVDELGPAPIPSYGPAPDSRTLLLEAELENPALNVLRKIQEESARWDFTKARQFTLALQAQRVHAGGASRERIESANNALRSYAQVSTTQLQRFFVRMRIDRTTGLLFANDDALDAAARALIAALIALFPA